MSIILLTGFEPFGSFETNPSQQIAERLHGENIGGARVVGLTLPVVFGEDTALAFAAIADHRPRLVLSLGLAAGISCLDMERFAVNLKAEEDVKTQTPIIADGFAALLATVNVEAMAMAAREAGVPAQAHSFAGAYLCNHLFYQILHYAQQWDLEYRAGFVHLPLSQEQVLAEQRDNQPSLPLDMMDQGIRAALEAALSHG